jgi:hypothetical protein
MQGFIRRKRDSRFAVFRKKRKFERISLKNNYFLTRPAFLLPFALGFCRNSWLAILT